MSEPENPDEPAVSPTMMAVRMAMKAAEEAAAARATAKAEARARAKAGELTPDDEDWEVIAATAVDRWAFEHGDAGAEPAAIDLGEAAAEPIENLDSLVQAIERELPEMPTDEVHGDLVIKRHDDKLKAWYELAANEALPAALRDLTGPVDVKRLLTALLIEVGDVKRTNAMLMEQLTRIEEKVERTNRHLRGQKTY